MRLVIFDVDGTLIDSRQIILAGVERTFRAHGLAVPDAREALGGVGLSLEAFLQRLVGDAALARAMAATYREAFHELRADPVNHEPLFPGAEAVVDTLAGRDDVVLGLATGKSRRGVRAILDRLGWHERFATIQTADDHPSKPNPSMITTALAETGAAPEATIMIGDTTFDVEMALGAGVTALGVSWGNHDPLVLRAAGAHAVVESFEDVLDFVERRR